MSGMKRYPVAPAPDRFDEALAARTAERRIEGHVEYVRMRTDSGDMPRGAVRVDGRVVPDYPRIARVFALEAGIRENVDGAFYAEEKIDGYNIRLFHSRGMTLPITRNGTVCPFTMDRLPDLVDPTALEAFFANHPDLIVCAEIAGRGNPYTRMDSPRVAGDLGLFAFDLMRYDSEQFVPVAERRAVLSEFNIPQAPDLGRYTVEDMAELKRQVLRLDAEGAEGIVIKPPADGLRLKYVTPSINVADVASDAPLEMELPGEFYVHRVVRMVTSLRELGCRDRELGMAEELGRALVSGFSRALDEAVTTGELAETYTVRLRHRETIDRLLTHLGGGSRTVHAYEVRHRRDGDHWELVFRKVYRRSTGKLQTLLGGGAMFD